MNTKERKALYRQLRDRYTVSDLLQIMMVLRSDDGCPWDREQTHDSLRINMLEEAYEAVDAILSGDKENLCEELGDVLMQVIFHAEIAQSEDSFTFDDVVTGICRKLVSRHTHVFGSDEAETAADVLITWEKNKKKEKNHQSAASSLQGVTRSLPALMRSYKVQKKAADVGFDWPDASGAADKIREELAELQCAEALPNGPDRDNEVEEELGDLLFSVVNYARHIGVQPEQALDRACTKFTDRFTRMEQAALQEGRSLEDMDLGEMDAWWDRIKITEQEPRKEKGGTA